MEVIKTDENGRQMRTILDDLGRIIELKGEDSNGALVTLEKYGFTKKSGVPGIILQTFKRTDWNQNDYHWEEVWKCPWGGEFKTRSRGVGLTAIVTEKALDLAGRVTSQSLEYFEPDTPEWIHYQHDIFNRVTQTIYPKPGVINTVDYLDAEQKSSHHLPDQPCD